MQCALPRTGFDTPSSGSGNSNVDAGGKRDMNQTLSSRQKRRNLAVDFAVPSLLRNYLTEFIKRPLNGDCLTFNGCYTVRANLQMHCIPLQKTISTFVDSKLAAVETAGGNWSSAGQLPHLHTRPLSKVLILGLTKASRKSNQVVVEIGEDVVRTGCGGLLVYEEAPVFTLEMDLTTILEWWLGAEGGRLRVRLMPEKRAQVPGMEDKYTAAIRAADPRLFLQIASRVREDMVSTVREDMGSTVREDMVSTVREDMGSTVREDMGSTVREDMGSTVRENMVSTV
ncbi:hypothetical protein NHX12_004051 [Muraenolepis orangiensis]|uniref:Uncharacterized protein n=1 Tax=Muraenolepis orangiensis TaxID=630683 RepID=A0A9Q0IDF5_9TELE|nr:hypothetical protein NHX12_004051 [Muraenolepis orangiensis]